MIRFYARLCVGHEFSDLTLQCELRSNVDVNIPVSAQ